MEGQLSTPIALKERERAVDLLAVGLVSLVVGAGTGVVSAAFRLVLANADRLRDAFVLWARGPGGRGFCLAVLVCAPRRFSPPGWFGEFRLTLPAAAFPMSRACCARSCRRPRLY